MLFRKTRRHLHGTSNRLHPDSRTHHSFSIQHSTIPQSKTPEPVLRAPLTSVLKKRGRRGPQTSCRGTEGAEDNEWSTKLRRMYKNNKNVVKLLNHWRLGDKGFMSRDEFQQELSRKLGQQITQDQTQQIIAKYGSQDHIDAQGLLTLLKGKTNGIPIDALTLPINNHSEHRQQLVNNLKESLQNLSGGPSSQLTDNCINRLLSKFNTGVSRLRHKSGTVSMDKSAFFRQLQKEGNFSSFEKELLRKVEEHINFQEMENLLQCHKNADYLVVDPLVRKLNTKNTPESPHKNPIEVALVRQMKSLPNLFQASLSQEQKRTPFDPLSLLNVDQRKTRFQKSLFTSESNGWTASASSLGVQSDQKERVMQTIRDQVTLKEARYQNKLAKMRAFRTMEQQRIEERQQKAGWREEGRLLRLREQQQAYNYVNYIKKVWD